MIVKRTQSINDCEELKKNKTKTLVNIVHGKKSS